MTSANLSVLKSELGTTAYMHLSVVMAHMQSYHFECGRRVALENVPGFRSKHGQPKLEVHHPYSY